MPNRKADPFVGRFTLKLILGPSSQKLRLYHRVALRIYERLPYANITGIVDAVVFSDYIGCNENQLLEAGLKRLEKEPLGFVAAHPRDPDPIPIQRSVPRAIRTFSRHDD